MNNQFDKGPRNDERAPSGEGRVPSRIFLVGFMGSGKTTVGRALARKLAYRFLDLDAFIEGQAGRKIREIFELTGEHEFRRLEADAVRQCAAIEQSVVALGGGAYISEANREVLRGLGSTIWLKCPLKICLSRISDDPARPLLQKGDVFDLYAARESAYRLADFTLRFESGSPDQLARRILKFFS